MAAFRELVLETVTDPHFILEGDSGELLAVTEYMPEGLPGPFLIVPYRELGKHDGFVLTAYFARRLSTRRTAVWKR